MFFRKPNNNDFIFCPRSFVTVAFTNQLDPVDYNAWSFTTEFFSNRYNILQNIAWCLFFQPLVHHRFLYTTLYNTVLIRPRCPLTLSLLSDNFSIQAVDSSSSLFLISFSKVSETSCFNLLSKISYYRYLKFIKFLVCF